MNVYQLADAKVLGQAAGEEAAASILKSIQQKGRANLILATGTSQFETLQQLLLHTEIDWSLVTLFHLDEYIGLPASNPASFRKYLLDRFINQGD